MLLVEPTSFQHSSGMEMQLHRFCKNKAVPLWTALQYQTWDEGHNKTWTLMFWSLGWGGRDVSGLRLKILLACSTVCCRLGLEKQKLAVIGQRHVLHQLGQSFWILWQKKTKHPQLSENSLTSLCVKAAKSINIPLTFIHQ